MTIIIKSIKLARQAWIIFGIALLMLATIEAGFSFGFYIRSFWHTPYIDNRINADTYSDTSWVAPYFEESERMDQMRWKPYVYWRRKPHNGKYVNLDSDGLRKTVDGTGREASTSKIKLFMFGGSTMWGAGVKDDLTIPSSFAKEIKQKGINCQVINLGVEGYSSTQEVIELMLQLQKGNIPDVVIFYDGFNDTFGAFQLGVPGLPHNEFNREMEFNLLESSELRLFAVSSEINQLYSIRFLSGALKSLGLRKENAEFIPLKYVKSISDRSALVCSVADTYLSNIRLVQALSEAYGFKCLFYWQPLLYQKSRLTEYERKALETEYKYAGMQEFYVEAYDHMQKRAAGLRSDSGVHDLSTIFADFQEPIFLDQCHLGEKGNSLIAKRMVEDFVHLLKVNGKTNEHGDAP